MAPSKKKCGPHVELSTSPAARLTRCGCGAVHVNLTLKGLTFQIDDETLRHLANACSAAVNMIDHADAPVPTGPELN